MSDGKSGLSLAGLTNGLGQAFSSAHPFGPHVLCLPTNWNGRQFWMMLASYTGSTKFGYGGVLLCSKDGDTWQNVSSPPMIGTNVSVYGYQGHSLMMFGNKLGVYYGLSNVVYLTTTSDGTNWGTPAKLWTNVTTTANGNSNPDITPSPMQGIRVLLRPDGNYQAYTWSHENTTNQVTGGILTRQGDSTGTNWPGHWATVVATRASETGVNVAGWIFDVFRDGEGYALSSSSSIHWDLLRQLFYTSEDGTNFTLIAGDEGTLSGYSVPLLFGNDLHPYNWAHGYSWHPISDGAFDIWMSIHEDHDEWGTLIRTRNCIPPGRSGYLVRSNGFAAGLRVRQLGTADGALVVEPSPTDPNSASAISFSTNLVTTVGLISYNTNVGFCFLGTGAPEGCAQRTSFGFIMSNEEEHMVPMAWVDHTTAGQEPHLEVSNLITHGNSLMIGQITINSNLSVGSGCYLSPTVTSSAGGSSILGGLNNTNTGFNCSVGGGTRNSIFDAQYSWIGAGLGNEIASDVSYGSIIGGVYNKLSAAGTIAIGSYITNPTPYMVMMGFGTKKASLDTNGLFSIPGILLPQAQFIPTNSIPIYTSGVTNPLLCNASNFGTILIRTNTAGSGRLFIRSLNDHLTFGSESNPLIYGTNAVGPYRTNGSSRIMLTFSVRVDTGITGNAEGRVLVQNQDGTGTQYYGHVMGYDPSLAQPAFIIPVVAFINPDQRYALEGIINTGGGELAITTNTWRTVDF